MDQTASVDVTQTHNPGTRIFTFVFTVVPGSLCTFVCISLCTAVRLYICLSVCLTVHLSVHLPICLSFCRSAFASVFMAICTPVWTFVCISGFTFSCPILLCFIQFQAFTLTQIWLPWQQTSLGQIQVCPSPFIILTVNEQTGERSNVRCMFCVFQLQQIIQESFSTLVSFTHYSHLKKSK